MAWIILTRNPRTSGLVAIVETNDSARLVEFTTEGEAEKSARHIPICQAWGYRVIEVEIS